MQDKSSSRKSADTVEPVKRGRGRPPKGDDALTVKLQVRVTAAENQEIVDALKLTGEEFSEWARDTLKMAARVVIAIGHNARKRR